MDTNSWFWNEIIAIANANGEFRANVVIVKLTYSGYVKFIFLDINKSTREFTIKNMINGRNIVIKKFRFSNNSFPWLENMQKTASDKNQISKSEIIFIALSFNDVLKTNFVICAVINGIMIIIKIE